MARTIALMLLVAVSKFPRSVLTLCLGILACMLADLALQNCPGSRVESHVEGGMQCEKSWAKQLKKAGYSWSAVE